MSDPTTALRADHRKVERLIQQMEKGEPAERSQLLEELTTSLRAHMTLEERVLYPVITDTIGEEAAQEADTEHRLAEVGLAKVTELAPDQPGFGAALEMLRAGIEHHVHEEEDQLFPELTKKLDAESQERLAQDLDANRRELGLPTTADLPDDVSKDELYKQAQKDEVPGRSDMTKEELAQAVAASKDREGFSG